MIFKKKLVVLSIFVLIIVLVVGCGKYDFGIVKSTDGEPVEEAKVVINGEEYVTNENGYFVLRGLNEGEYNVIVKKDGYREKFIEIVIDDKSRELDEIIIEPIE